MTTRLDGPLKRAVTVDGLEYTLTIDPEGLKLVAKGHRKGQALTWSALVSGEAALATALTASLAAASDVAARKVAPTAAPRKTARRRPGRQG